MNSGDRLQSTSVVDQESQRIELLELLKQDTSLNFKRVRFLRFFGGISASKEQNRFRSYYLEFENWLPLLTDGLPHYGCDPESLETLCRIIRQFKASASGPEIAQSLAAALQKARTVLALTYLYVGESTRAAKALDANIEVEERRQGIVHSELEMAEAFVSLVSKSSHQQAAQLQTHIQKWTVISEEFATDSIHVLLVDDSAAIAEAESAQGVILNLSGSVRERPTDAEEDRILLNNQLHFQESCIYWTLLDGAAAVRSILTSERKLISRYYSYQFSLPEKGAELTGNSLGAAAAILAHAMLLNRFYRMPVASLGAGVAITGGINQPGKILPVEPRGLKAKLSAAFFSPLKRIMVPWENHTHAVNWISQLKQKYPNRHLAVQSVETLVQALHDRNLVRRERISIARKSVSTFKRISFRSYLLTLPILVVVAAVLLFMFGIIGPLRHGQPANYQIEGSELRIFDAEQNFLWTHDFEAPLTRNNYFSEHYQNVVIDDIDHDGRIDILFGTYENNNAELSGNVWRFDHKGKILWQRHVGREIRFGGKKYGDSFRIAYLFVRDLDGDGANEILVVGHHWPDFPVCVQIYNVDGDLISEYWHAGQFDAVSFADLDNDGVEEILLGGQNNEFGNAVLAVLDFRHLRGCSPQTPGTPYFPDSLAQGTEKYYLRFPRTVFEKFGVRDQIFAIQAEDHGMTAVVTNYYPNRSWSLDVRAGMVYYELNRKMNLTVDPVFGDLYKQLLANRFGIAPDDINVKHYRKILYWDGERWKEEVTMNRKYEGFTK